MVITPGCGCSNSTAMKKRGAFEETALYVEPSIVVYGLFKRFDGLFAGNDYATTFAISRCLHRGNRLGSEAIAGVPTSITLFIGMAREGDLNRPTPIRGVDEFEQAFGSDVAYGEMALQVKQFFLNGGTEAIVVRLEGDDGGSPELADYENA